MERMIFLFLFLNFLLSDIHSQNSINIPQNVDLEKIALVIGNGNYSLGTLANPENDARSMSEVLRTLGFEVFSYENLTQSQMKRAIADFGMRLRGKDVGLFYYAGHGIQAKGFNYLIPVDAELRSEEDVDYYCVRADMILGSMETSGTGVNVIILDACRNNPFERSWTRSANGKGLAFMSAPKGTLIAYATAPGSTASDGSGSNGLYTEAILESIQKPGITIEEMFKNVRKLVSEKSQNQQIPWESTSLTGNFYFKHEIGQSSIDSNNNSSNFEDVILSTITDSVENIQYKTKKIGNQTWMIENLKATRFRDGTQIPSIKDQKLWKKQVSAAQCSFDDDDSEDHPSITLKSRNEKDYWKNKRGLLYNWYVVAEENLCPSGWHIPSDREWATLSLAISEKDKSIFFPEMTGWREANGEFMSFYSYYWTSSEVSSDNALAWRLWDPFNGERRLERTNESKKTGFSVRCIKD